MEINALMDHINVIQQLILPVQVLVHVCIRKYGIYHHVFVQLEPF
jgi:hypothetical protein